jgi:hypothetical protein
MPKVSNTRKQRALQLLGRLREGPSFSPFQMSTSARRQASEQFKLWSGSWIIYELIDLVPELRKLHKEGKIKYEKSGK